MGPFMVFLITYIMMFFAAFYLFGQQQVGFNYYYKKNQDELESGKLRPILTIKACSTTAHPLFKVELKVHLKIVRLGKFKIVDFDRYAE